MAGELSTAGILVYYAPEATAGTQPTTGWVNIPNIKKIPEVNSEPSAQDVTDLSDTEWKRSIPGLKDAPGSVSFTANNNDAFQTAWGTLVTAYETALSGTKEIWFAVIIPEVAKAFAFTGAPAPLGLSAIEVDGVLEIDAYVTLNAIKGWVTKPTVS